MMNTSLLEDCANADFQLFHKTENALASGFRRFFASRRFMRQPRLLEQQMDLLLQENLKLQQENLWLKRELEQHDKDFVTGLNIRSAGEKRLRDALASRALQPVCLMLVDVDHFKDINTRYTHNGGDRVLATLATRISACLRVDDFVYRYGGDEFMVVTRGAPLEQARTVADRLRTAMGNPIMMEGNNAQLVNISIGLAQAETDETPQASATSETRLALARTAVTTALQKAKENGRNQVVG